MQVRVSYFLILWLGFAAAPAIAQSGKTLVFGKKIPAAPLYSNDTFWASLPWKTDPADNAPAGLHDSQSTARADVFFIHPTSFSKKQGDSFYWNASLDDEAVNKNTDNRSIRYQASVFNGSARIFAPRYRQAHLDAFYFLQPAEKQQVLNLAYSDVKAAFEYYLLHHNQGRPIIIASHSQGTVHAHRILQDFFEGKPLQKKLIAAYLPGMPVPADSFSILKPCDTAAQCGCWYSWRTFRYGYEPYKWDAVCHNPLSWTMDNLYYPKKLHKGAVLTDFKKIRKGICDGQVHEGILWIHRPKFPGSRLIKNPNYHIGDYNLFYMDIRENVRKQVESYFSRGE